MAYYKFGRLTNGGLLERGIKVAFAKLSIISPDIKLVILSVFLVLFRYIDDVKCCEPSKDVR